MGGFLSQAFFQGEKKQQSRLPECGRCGLLKQCQSPKMPPSGKGKRSILFVGEAPGQKEDERGVQFVGKAGQHLRGVLHNLDCELDDCTVTNSIACHPPANKIDNKYIDCCRPLLLGAIRDTKPSVIILLGGSAVRGLMPAEREADVGAVARWVGWRIPSHEHQAWVCPTYHPSYLLRTKSPVLEMIFKEHIKRALAKEDKPIRLESLDSIKAKVECITDPHLARVRVKELATKSGVLAFDYESNRLKPDHTKSRIYSCSFCLDGEDTFAVPVDDEMLPLISTVLKNPRLKKVASNLKNEERWTRRIMGHPVKSWHWDTMLAAHVLDNRTGITSLKFQSFVRFGIADYDRVVAPFFESGRGGFNRIHEVPMGDLLVYNALDSLLEYKLMEVQRKEMGLSCLV